MLPCFEHAFQIHETSVALHKIAVNLGRNLASLQQPRAVHRTNHAIGSQPTKSVGVDLIARNLPAANLLNDSVTLQREEQKAGSLVNFRPPEMLPFGHVRSEAASHIATVSAIRKRRKTLCGPPAAQAAGKRLRISSNPAHPPDTRRCPPAGEISFVRLGPAASADQAHLP